MDVAHAIAVAAQHLDGVGPAVHGVAGIEEQADDLRIRLRQQTVDLLRRLHERARVVVDHHRHG